MRPATPALILAALLALPGLARAQANPGAQCIPASNEHMRLAGEVNRLESQDERLRKRMQMLIRARGSIPRLPPAELSGRLAAARQLVAEGQSAIPGEDEDGARAAERQILAETTLALLQAAQAGGAAAVDELAQQRTLDASGMRRSLTDELARLRPAASDALRQAQACSLRAFGPLPPFTPDPLAPGFVNLRGKWVSQRAPGAPWLSTEVGQVDGGLSILDEYGAIQAARLTDRTISADEWLDAITGEVSPDGREIRWENGMIWRRP